MSQVTSTVRDFTTLSNTWQGMLLCKLTLSVKFNTVKEHQSNLVGYCKSGNIHVFKFGTIHTIDNT